MATGTASELEWIRSVVEKHFKVYDSRVDRESILLYLDAKDRDLINSNFQEIQKELKSREYVATLDYTGGEYAITAFRMPATNKQKKLWINKILFIATFATTTLAGMYIWSGYDELSGMWTLETVLMGAVTFAVPLMAILGIHELGHYYAAKRHGLNASLPYFIPSIPPFGTFGAFISLREPMPDRKALVDIGAAGPMCGFLVTLPVAVLGLYLTAQGGVVAGEASAGMAYITLEPIYSIMAHLYPAVDGLAMHPMAFAGWVGFFITGINLLPIGQLDGGHIARGLLGDKAKWLSYAAFLVLLACVFLYDGWLLFALLIILIGVGHPPPLNNLSKIDKKTAAFGTVTLLLILITFIPQPISVIETDYSFEIEDEMFGNNMVSFTVINTGNTSYDLTMTIADGRCTQTYYVDGEETNSGIKVLHLTPGEEKMVMVNIHPSEGSQGEITLHLSSSGFTEVIKIPISS